MAILERIEWDWDGEGRGEEQEIVVVLGVDLLSRYHGVIDCVD